MPLFGAAASAFDQDVGKKYKNNVNGGKGNNSGEGEGEGLRRGTGEGKRQQNIIQHFRDEVKSLNCLISIFP